jgi:hypothetical protein
MEQLFGFVFLTHAPSANLQLKMICLDWKKKTRNSKNEDRSICRNTDQAVDKG